MATDSVAAAEADPGDEVYTSHPLEPLDGQLLHYPQVTQETNFDCGLACLRMVLRGLPSAAAPEAAEVALSQAIAESGLGRSIWSPDLLYLLMRCGVPARLFSCCLEPNPDYAQLSYYNREFSSDQQRVIRHLSWIRARDPSAAVQEPVQLDAILDHLGRRLGPIVCLTDSSKLEAARLQACLGCSSCLPNSGSYQGHYILLCGFCRKRSKFFYRNPMCRADKYKSVTFQELEVARKAYGTDEDLIFIYAQAPP